jgi:CRISPR-associated protein Csd2
MSIQHRYDFVFLFDVKDGNPNGDPDAGNLPRLDTETGQGLVTDVSIKRKIRNYVGMVKGKPDGSFEPGYDIYIKEKAVLGRAHFAAFEKCDINLGQDLTEVIPEGLVEQFNELVLPDGMDRETDDEDRPVIRLTAVLDKEEVKQWLKETELSKQVKDFIGKALKNVKARKPKQEETEKGRVQMCKDFYDIRTFGAVLSLKTAPNCGQVRGPVQLTFARSLDSIVTLEHSITRCAVATEAEATKQSGDNRTMGRKFTVPYGLYRAHGFISAHFAGQTQFGEDDLKLLWEALTNMFDHDHSAARGEMATRGLYVFKHDSHLGNAPAYKLFDLIQVSRSDPTLPARSIADYQVTAPPTGKLANYPGVELQILC